MATKKPVKAKGAAKAAPLRQMVTLRFLEPVVDQLTGEAFRISMRFPLFEIQLESGDFADVMDANHLVADRSGFGFDLIHGRFRHEPEGWSAAWTKLGLPALAEGFRAFAAMKATQAAMVRADEHPLGPRPDDFRDFLLAAVLKRLAEGESWRAAVAAVNEEFDPTGSDETLLRALSRYLKP